jgi:hypothetical protein
MLDITRKIFECTYSLSSNSKKELTREAVVKALGKNFNRDEILTALPKEHGEVNNINISGDSTLLKHTSHVVLQAEATRRSAKKSRGALTDPSRILHVSVIEFGRYLSLPKADPTGRTRGNVYANVLPDGRLERDPARQPLFDRIQKNIQR